MMQMRIEGGMELVAAIRQLPSRVGKRMLTEALKDAAEPMRERMGELAPRAPGAPDLADNIVISTTTRVANTVDGFSERTDDQVAAVAVGPAKGFFYGFFQEFGTIWHGAQPFARPAFDSESPQVLVVLARALWAALAGKGISRSRSVSGGVTEGGSTGGGYGLGEGGVTTRGGTGL